MISNNLTTLVKNTTEISDQNTRNLQVVIKILNETARLFTQPLFQLEPSVIASVSDMLLFVHDIVYCRLQ